MHGDGSSVHESTSLHTYIGKRVVNRVNEVEKDLDNGYFINRRIYQPLHTSFFVG